MSIPSGHLPYEDKTDWKAALEPAFVKAREPFDALRDWIMAPEGLKGRATKPMDEATIYGFGALVAKLLKSYRGVLILCERGHGFEGLTLVRVVLETAAQIVWACRASDPRIAMLKVLAHEQLKRAVLYTFNDMTADVSHANTVAATYGKRIVDLGGRYDISKLTKHWHCLNSFERLCCDELGWEQHYQFLYRFTSMPTHAADISLHIRAHEDGLPMFSLGPGDYLVDDCLSFAPVLLWQVIEELQKTLTTGGLPKDPQTLAHAQHK